MKLDLTSFAFGFRIADSAGNPNWATSLGQGAEYKINDEATVNELLKGLVYSSIPLASVQAKIGKGGKVYRGDDPLAAIVLASEFRKVFVNERRVKNCRLILLLTRDTSKSHEGRLRLKYSPHSSLLDSKGKVLYSNGDGLSCIREALGVSDRACWFVYALDVINQDELHLSVGVASSRRTSTYKTTAALHKHWQSLIPKPEKEDGNTWIGDGADKDSQTRGDLQIPSVDNALAVALKLFAQHRSADDWADGYRAVNAGIREYFGKLTAEKVATLDAAGLTELFEGVKDSEGKRTFMPMWGGSPGNGYSHIKGAIEGAADEVRAFLLRIRRDTALVSQFTRKGFARPGGFGKSVVSELLMKFHPDSALLYDSKTRDALKFLGCADFEPKVDFDETEYTRVMGIAAEIKSRMADMGIARTLEDAADARERDTPDYLTVNEFVAWVVGHKDLIKEEIDMGNINNLKRVEEKPTYEEGAKGLEAFGEDEMLKRLAAALKTKPFAILAGHSGTGKSQLVRCLAHMTCNVESLRKEADDTTLPGNYCMVQVKPNWHDSNDLLGYYSDMNGRHYRTTPFVEFICKAYAYPDTPFFVCLDEMNLAPVEHYFAEYLSAIESADIKGDVYVTDPVVTIDSSAGADGKKKRDGAIAMEMMGSQASANAAEWLMAHDLTLPKNLFVVGTVNMDETTQQFSRKVLDRAMTILMDRVDFASMKKPEMPKCMNEEAVKFFLGHSVKTDALTPEQAGLLGNVNEVLKNTSFVVAYRFANEYALYQEAIEQIDPSGKDEAGKAKRALDHMVMMKLLPRIHGERHDVAAIFGNEDGRDGLRKIVGSDGLSGVQMASILGRGGDYLTFWP